MLALPQYEGTMYVRLKVAYDDGHRVVTSAAVLAEIVCGSSRDAGVDRVLARMGVEPVSETIGRRAGQLIGAAGMSSGPAVDAMVAATAIAAAEQAEAADRAASVLLVTSDLPDLTRLVRAPRRCHCARRPARQVMRRGHLPPARRDYVSSELN
jgi:predicted nucleic acid-binding protein